MRFFFSAGRTMDVCGCCEECAKDVGQKCGGLWGMDGTCGEHLECFKPRKEIRDLNEEKPYEFQSGICRAKSKLLY